MICYRRRVHWLPPYTCIYTLYIYSYRYHRLEPILCAVAFSVYLVRFSILLQSCISGWARVDVSHNSPVSSLCTLFASPSNLVHLITPSLSGIRAHLAGSSHTFFFHTSPLIHSFCLAFFFLVSSTNDSSFLLPCFFSSFPSLFQLWAAQVYLGNRFTGLFLRLL